MHFHLPLLNPFLANGSDFGHGANFAVAGGTAQDFATLAAQNITYRLANNASLASQLGWFNYHITSICYSPAGTCTSSRTCSFIYYSLTNAYRNNLNTGLSKFFLA